MKLILILLLIAAITALFFGPRWWAQRTFRRHAAERPDLAGTGGELARHLLDRFGLQAVGVEELEKASLEGEGSAGDHYDPEKRVVRLARENYRGRSLTAVAIAAHEVGHALQHARGERLFFFRLNLAHVAFWAQRAGAFAMLALPLITLLTRHPIGGLATLGVGLASLGSAALLHLATLPVEWDASFGKALPILREGRYVAEQDLAAVEQVLKAAALTYLAASLASLLNLARWWRLLRR